MSENRVVIRSVAAGRGADWIAETFRWFRAAPVPWIASFLTLALLIYLLSRAPEVLQVAGDLLLPVLIGGLMIGCEAQARGQPLQFAHLFAGFAQPPLGGLLLLGLVSLVGFALVLLGVIAALGATMAGALVAGGGVDALQLGPGMLLALLVALLLIAPLAMALWFAPPLVAVYGLGAGAALRASLRAGLRNPGALLVNGVLLLLIAIVATIPLGLGWLLAGPLLLGSIHAGCRDLFERAQPNSSSG